MAKLYVFGIGGTGSRVIKSLTMLLATGIECNGYEIVPIIIDPDQANGDVTRTIGILNSYKNIREKLSFSDTNINKFFQASITDTTKGFKLELSNVRNDKFKDYIGYAGLDTNNKALANLLFSDDNLNSDMEVGFKGNPNIGSVVLNQFDQSQDFIEFASSFGSGDRIFIISSIFGGTGAAGFPLLLKNLRNGSNRIPNQAYLKDAPIGAITMLPYFGVKPDENSKIDKATFISKTKSALNYYDKNVSGTNSINALYYLGDEPNMDYENNEGSFTQKNDAHFLELVAALSVIDFANIDSNKLTNIEGIADSPIYKEFGVKVDVNELEFSNLGDFSQSILKKNLTQYQLFQLYFSKKLKENEDRNWAQKMDMKTFFGKPFYNDLKLFNKSFVEWLQELEKNRKSFKPFNLNADDSNLFQMVNGIKPKKGLLDQGGDNYGRYNHIISKEHTQIPYNSQEQYFISLFYKATETLVNEKYNF